MTRKNRLLATVSTILIAAATPAIAADNAKSQMSDGKAKMEQATKSAAYVVRPLFGASVHAEDLIGKSVKNFDGDTVGDVESVLLDRSGRVQAVVVGVGGFLGMGEHEVAINWQDLYLTDNGDEIHTELTKETLKQVPEYKYEKEDMRGKAFGDNRYRDTRRDARKHDYAADRPRELRESASADEVLDASGNLKTSELIGMEVVDKSQKTIGEIEEIVLSKDGKPQAAVGTGGFLGIGKKVVLVSWDKIDIHREKDQVQIRTALSEADLEKMPERKE